MAELTIKNIRVIELYNKYTIDIEKINLMMVNILENVILNLESNITKNLVSNVLQYVNIQTKNVTGVNLEFNNIIKNNILFYITYYHNTTYEINFVSNLYVVL